MQDFAAYEDFPDDCDTVTDDYSSKEFAASI